MHWNAEGVSNKREELQHFLHENNVNICCIQETHLQDDKSFKIRGYQVFRSDRKERKKERKVLTGRAPYRLVVISSVILAVNACCCGLLECANYGPAPPTSALRVSVKESYWPKEHQPKAKRTTSH
jgi:hypothetical protein